jgi:hypothetical protein
LYSVAAQDTNEESAGTLYSEQIAASESTETIPRVGGKSGEHGHSRTRLNIRRHQPRGGFKPLGQRESQNRSQQQARNARAKQESPFDPQQAQPPDSGVSQRLAPGFWHRRDTEIRRW